MSLIRVSKQSRSRRDVHDIATTAVELQEKADAAVVELQQKADAAVVQERIASREEVLQTLTGYMHSGSRETASGSVQRR